MLNNVPIQVNRAARQVTLRHPNGMDCSLWKKVILRVNDPADNFGGLPTIGGAGVLDSEDEADYTYEFLADAKISFTGQYIGADSNTIDTENGLNYFAAAMEALIECTAELGSPEWVMPDKPMVVTVFPGNGVVVPYQIVGTTGNVNIPPYTRKYVLNPLSDSESWPTEPQTS